ncbi:MAG: hypothetical protein ACOCZE_05675 [Planctomycetota bacterium]
MIYATFAFWLLLILFAGIGVYRLWASLVRPIWVNWALLPGTLVSELAYIFGCLITGGQIRHAHLLPRKNSGRGSAGEGEPVTQDEPRLKIIGPAVASLMAVLASLAALLCLHTFLESPAIRQFVIESGQWNPFSTQGLPRQLPGSWAELWSLLHFQLDLLRGMVESWSELPWSDWRVWVFIYLAGCLAIRLAPVGRDLRWPLAAMVLIALLIALAGLVSEDFDDLIRDGDLWYFLTYVWTLLLFLLAATGLIRAAVGLVRILAGKSHGRK